MVQLPFTKPETTSVSEEPETNPVLDEKIKVLNATQRIIFEGSVTQALDGVTLLLTNVMELNQLPDESERTINHTNRFGMTTKFIMRKNKTGFSIKVKS